MTDIVTYCDVNTCEDCPRYGDDCDGDKRVKHTDLISRADAIKAVASITMSIHLSEVICDKLLALPSADAVHIHNDGTLEVKVPNAQKFGRVLVTDTDSHIGGGLFYPDDAVHGEWKFVDHEIFAGEYFCNICGKRANVDLYGEWILSNYCPSCGARMTPYKGGDTE